VSKGQVGVSLRHGEDIVVELVLVICFVAMAVRKLACWVTELFIQLVKKLVRLNVLSTFL
jgi:hypothetical protein